MVSFVMNRGPVGRALKGIGYYRNSVEGPCRLGVTRNLFGLGKVVTAWGGGMTLSDEDKQLDIFKAAATDATRVPVATMMLGGVASSHVEFPHVLADNPHYLREVIVPLTEHADDRLKDAAIRAWAILEPQVRAATSQLPAEEQLPEERIRVAELTQSEATCSAVPVLEDEEVAPPPVPDPTEMTSVPRDDTVYTVLSMVPGTWEEKVAHALGNLSIPVKTRLQAVREIGERRPETIQSAPTIEFLLGVRELEMDEVREAINEVLATAYSQELVGSSLEQMARALNNIERTAADLDIGLAEDLAILRTQAAIVTSLVNEMIAREGIPSAPIAVAPQAADRFESRLDELLAERERLLAEKEEAASALAAKKAELAHAEETTLSRLENRIREINQQIEQAALIITYQADRKYDKLNLKQSAIEDYNRVIELYPQTHWAQHAREKLEQIESQEKGMQL